MSDGIHVPGRNGQSAIFIPRREPSPATREAIQEAMAIHRGDKPNRVSAAWKGVPVSMEEFRRQTATLVDQGKLVADPVYVKVVNYDDVRTKLGGYWLWHYDTVGFFTKKRVNVLGHFFHSHLQTKVIPPILRVMTGVPIINTGWGGTMDGSFQAIERSDLADLLRLYLERASFVRRFTKAQRAEYKEKTNQDLLDQYWETERHPVKVYIGARVVSLDLYLPSGMDYRLDPLNFEGEAIRFAHKEPSLRVQAAGSKVFMQDYLDIPVNTPAEGLDVSAIKVIRKT